MGTTHVAGNFTQSGGALEIELGATSDTLVVTGSASLGGQMAVLLSDGFVPSIGQVFTILSAGELSGMFDGIVFPSLDHGGWAVAYTSNSLVLRVTLPGDFNLDGVVDAADYVVWRKNDGTQAGFDLWRAHFGETGGSGSGATGSESANGTVPEPVTLMILILAAAGVSTRWRTWRAAVSTKSE
jgi:hypothetical protein